MVVPPIGAAKGKMRSPVKARIASSAENSAAPASMTKPTITSARAGGIGARAWAAIVTAAAACKRKNRAPLSASSPPLSWTPAAARATPAAPMSAAMPARMRGERFIRGSIADEADRRDAKQSSGRTLVKTVGNFDPVALAYRVQDERGRAAIVRFQGARARAHGSRAMGAAVARLSRFLSRAVERRGRQCDFRAHL